MFVCPSHYLGKNAEKGDLSSDVVPIHHRTHVISRPGWFPSSFPFLFPSSFPSSNFCTFPFIISPHLFTFHSESLSLTYPSNFISLSSPFTTTVKLTHTTSSLPRFAYFNCSFFDFPFSHLSHSSSGFFRKAKK